MVDFDGFHVGKYINPMDAMGIDDRYIAIKTPGFVNPKRWNFAREFSQNARSIQVFEILELQYPKGQQN